MNSETIINIVILSAAIPSFVFPILYHWTSSWAKTRMGRSLMVSAATVASLFMLGVLAMIFGDGYPGQEIVRLGVIGMLLFMQWFQLISYILTVRQVRKTMNTLEELP